MSFGSSIAGRATVAAPGPAGQVYIQNDGREAWEEGTVLRCVAGASRGVDALPLRAEADEVVEAPPGAAQSCRGAASGVYEVRWLFIRSRRNTVRSPAASNFLSLERARSWTGVPGDHRAAGARVQSVSLSRGPAPEVSLDFDSTAPGQSYWALTRPCGEPFGVMLILTLP